MTTDIQTALPKTVGVGYKPQHYADILRHPPSLGWLEVHAENYLGSGGRPIAQLRALREHYAFSVHGVGLSIGSEQGIDPIHLSRVKELCDWLNPAQFSEHLAWSTHDVGFLNDLLPLPYDTVTLNRVVTHIDLVQTTLGRQMLLENPSSYLGFQRSTYDECEFLSEIANRTGCGLLLDVNNVFVSYENMDWDIERYLDAYPMHLIGEIHLGGHDEEISEAGQKLLIDTHGAPVVDPVWELYQRVIANTGPLPTLIEWDTDVPEWDVLYHDVTRASHIMTPQRAVA